MCALDKLNDRKPDIWIWESDTTQNSEIEIRFGWLPDSRGYVDQRNSTSN